MDIREAIDGWLASIQRVEKKAQVVPVQDDPDPTPPPGRLLIDGKATRQSIMDTVKSSVEKRFPIENDKYRLELHDVGYDGPTNYTLEQQKQAILHNRKLGCSLAGTWRLIDKASGKVIDERRDAVIRVPYYTDRGTIINNGSEYTVISQARLSPGVYTRRKQNGDLESQFNVANGKGFRLELDKRTGRMNFRMGQANIPLYPVLKAFGVTDQQLAKAWGSDVALANSAKNDPKAMQRLYEKIAGYKVDPLMTPQNQAKFVQDELQKFGLDPATVVRTLGVENVTGVTPEVILRASQKLLNINRGIEEPDNRDNPRFSKFYGIEHMLGERIDKDSAKLLKPMLFRISRDKSLARVGRNALGPYIDDFLSTSGLAQPGEEANPMSILIQQSRITRTGEGGISSPDLITPEARGVQGDYLGFVDFIAGPECMPHGCEVFTKTGWMKWEDTTANTEFACMIDGRLEYHVPFKHYIHDYNGDLFCARTKEISYRYTPNHRMYVSPTMKLKNGERPKFRFEFASDVCKRVRLVLSGGHKPYIGNGYDYFELPPVDESAHNQTKFDPFKMEDWAEFMGWYLSEGNTYIRYGKTSKETHYNVRITQDKYYDELEKCVSKLPIHFNKIRPKGNHNGCIHITSKQLALYLYKFGKSWDKYIPEYFFEASVEARKRLLHGLLMGDGRKKRDTWTYMTVSKRLAQDVERLGFSLGYSCHLRFERDDRPQSNYGGTYAVHFCTNNVHTLSYKTKWTPGHYYTEHYKGKVYCANVPGHLLYVRSSSDSMGHWTGNSQAAGVDVRASHGAILGNDNKLYNMFRNMRTGKKEYLSVDAAADKCIAFPDQDPKAKYMYCMRHGVPTRVKTSEVDYMVPSFSRTIGAGINMNPMPTAVFGQRSFYSSKFWEQYLPQKEGEIPLVDSLMPDGKMTFNEFYGRKSGCVTAPFAGTVTSVTKDSITIRGKDGKTESFDLVNNLPYNRMTQFSLMPTVKKGMEINEGDILAHSNFTDAKTGAFNMGRNLKVAILPGPRNANSFEDALIFSEDAAKKLATSRMYNFDQDTKNGVSINKNKYLAAFPKTFTKEQADTLDDSGVVKVGTELNRGDPIIVALGPKMLSSENAQLGKLSSVLKNALTDKSQTWNHDWPGVVTDVVASPSGAKVLIKSEPPLKVGDKASGRFALKGVTGTILPMDKMPRDAVTNEPYDMLVNPMGFLSRVAPGQLMEIALRKVAKKTGKQIRIPQIPPPEGWLNWTKKQMADAGVTETADVFDPQTGRTIKGVGDGYMFVQAMHHLAEKKFSARGIEGGYTQDQQPAKGGETGAKKISGFDTNALLSHGATEVLKDAMTIRGQNNEEYWRKLRLGLPIPEPGVPFIYQKFINNLKAGGINVVEKGDVTSLMPQTDAEIEKLSEGRIIDSSQMVDADMNPVKGGLFDLSKTGGAGGTRWSMIELPEPVPNPVMEEPVRRVLGLTAKGLSDILSGKEQLNGKTGGAAIKEALSNIDVPRLIQQARNDIKTKRGSSRDNAVKILGYLTSADKMKISPADWMISKVPVIPPAFRPISRVGDVALVPDTNELYKELIETKHNYEILKDALPDSAITDERLNIYKSVKAAFGLGNSVTTEGQAKNLKGPIKQIIGTVPKWGQFQSKVVAKNQDLVGRSVTVPDKNLSMDQVGIPEDMAWTMYKPFVTRGLVQRGYSPVTAAEMIEKRTQAARHILDDVMAEKPVLMDRAPTWHKFNIMAFKPFITEGKEIRVCPMIDSGFNMDHDGDQQIGQIRVKISENDTLKLIEKNPNSQYSISMTNMLYFMRRMNKECKDA